MNSIKVIKIKILMEKQKKKLKKDLALLKTAETK